MVKYVNYGHPRYGTHMYVIVMNRTERGNYRVEVSVCDNAGTPVSDPRCLGYSPYLVGCS